MINKIERGHFQFDFDKIIDDHLELSYDEHRRGSSFYSRAIFKINEKYFPELPREYDGYWESNMFTRDTEWGWERSEINTLTRVEKVEKVVKTLVWEEVK